MNPTTKTSERVAAEVRAGLARKKMTQRQLAARLGMGLPTLSRRLNGQSPFNVEELAAISQILGIGYAIFFEGDAA